MTVCAAHATRRANAAAGFTLVEMLIVLTILALVAAIAGPGLIKRYRTVDLQTSASEIVTRFRASRTVAIATAKPQRIVIAPQARSIHFDDRHTIDLPQDVEMVVTTGRETTVDGREAILTFLPNGSASGMKIDLRQKGQSAHIEVNWLTGLSTLRGEP
ncbi:prepilin-type N-terminal cleavage/methylation domain-containing protein [Bradyrhizobium sp. Arg314]